MIAKDSKNRKVMAFDTEGILRIVQSIPSSKAEAFKLWLAKVGSERPDKMQAPEFAINRALQYYLANVESLRDNMSNMELVLNMLAVVSTTEILN